MELWEKQEVRVSPRGMMLAVGQQHLFNSLPLCFSSSLSGGPPRQVFSMWGKADVYGGKPTETI